MVGWIIVLIAAMGFWGCAAEETVNHRSGKAGIADSVTERTVQTDTGQIGPVPVGLVGGTWEVGPCGSMSDEGEVKTTQSEFIAQGLGELAVAVAPDAQLDLQIDFSLCEPHYYARAIVFVVDTSGSMRSTENIGTDPVYNNSCGRLEAIRSFLDALPPANQVRVGFVTFSTDVDKDSSKLYDAETFRREFLNTSSLCHKRLGTSGYDTNYSAGLGRAEELFAAYGGQIDSQEVYLITDGLPASSQTDGRVEASRLRETGLVGTLLIGSNDGFITTYISSKKPNGDPIHAQASNAGALSSALADTIGSRAQSGVFLYKSEDVDTWVEFPLDPDLTFFHASGMIRSDYTGPLDIQIKDADENGTIRKRHGRLEIIRRTP